MTTALDHIRPNGTPARIGQATAVEQSRAVAEVQAAVIVAQQCPRIVRAAVDAMEEACRQPALAARAFFRYPRGSETVSGPSVYLARELARTWGNIQHGITELARDDEHGQSEMQAWAWDVQTNTRSSNTFIVPHRRDTRQGARDLTDTRDIYENNANQGARRLREAIFSVLPAWYTEQAKALCTQTIEDGGGKPLPVRIADAVKAFERLRVTPARIAAKFGYDTVDELTAADVGQLGVIYDSLKQGTVTVDEEFPAEQPAITAADIMAEPAAGIPQTADDPAETPPPHAPVQGGPRSAGEAGEPGGSDPPRSSGLVPEIMPHLARLAGDDLPDQHMLAAQVLGLSAAIPIRRLAVKQQQQLLAVVERCGTLDDLKRLMTTGEAAQHPQDTAGGEA